MARKRRSYTDEFKREAVRLVQERGLTYTQVGRDLGVGKSLIRDWCLKAASTAEEEGEASSGSAVEAELRRLRRENAILREEREILKKAAAFFAKETR